MKLVSFEGIGQVLATFEAEEGVREGQVVKVSGPGRAAPVQTESRWPVWRRPCGTAVSRCS